MGLGFVTPLGALFAISALVPLAMLVLRRRRLRVIRSALGLKHPTLGSQLSLVLGFAGVPVLLGLAAAQPVIETTRTLPERTDAQVFVVVDVSRSMLASAKPGAPSRYERARAVALGLSNQLPEVPFGIASLVSGVLPHLFPTTDARVFAAALAKTVDPTHAPPAPSHVTLATNLNGLHSVPELNYFPPTATRRVLVVLTDGETQPLEPRLARAYNRRPRIETVFVRFWDADERIYETGVAEGGYQPDPRSEALLASAAELVGGQVFEEDDATGAATAVRAAIGAGETIDRKHETGRLALMPYLTLAALLPLGFVLVRRNVWWASVPRLRRGTADVVEGAKVSEPRGVAQPG
jgi:von Willebrand factor type A domain